MGGGVQLLGELHGLETLALEDNELGAEDGGGMAMGQCLTGLSRLQCLNVAQCRLSHLPVLVERLCGLRILDLTNNRSGTIRFGSTPQVPAERLLEYYRISLCQAPCASWWISR